MKLEKEFQFFLTHQAELVANYNGKYIVIMGEEVVGVFSTKQEAYDTASKNYKLGTFLIQHCLPGNKGTTQTFHSQVIFRNLIRSHA